MLELTIDESDKLLKIAHALSSEIRLEIIKLLNYHKLNIIDIAKELDLPVSTVATNIRVLENTGLIFTEKKSARRGTMKICTRNFNEILLKLNPAIGYNDPGNCYEVEIPLGLYTDCEVSPTCGLMNRQGVLKPSNDTNTFFHPERMTSGLLWFRKGYIDYKFPVTLRPNSEIESVQFSMELCSEAPNYNHDWPSDITIWINDQDIGTWTCPGDFGDRRGRLNPEWMPSQHTQYGLLKTWKVNQNGSYLDDVKISDVRLNQLNLSTNQPVHLRIGIKSDAANIGGINLFGKQFGDFDQDIIMRIIYS